MDAKYLAEIKAREQATTPGPWEEKTNRHPQCNGEPWGWISGSSGNITWSGYIGKTNADFIAHARTDIPALLAEVERLKKDRDNLKAQLDMYGGDEGITSALQEAVDCRKEAAAANLEKAKLNRQIATLEKALELACEDAADSCCPYEIYSWDCGKSGVCPNQVEGREDSGIDKQCWYDYYIRQAQKQEGEK